MKILLDTWVNEDCTVGRMRAGSFKCFTLELPWEYNHTGISCIPAGIYPVRKYNSPSKGQVLLLENVENRDFIEIHAGNYTNQIEGCILVGNSIRYLDSDSIPDVTNSRSTLKMLLNSVTDDATIHITRAFSPTLHME